MRSAAGEEGRIVGALGAGRSLRGLASANSLARVGGFRTISLAGGAVTGTVAAWILVDRFGASGFAIFTLLSSLLVMLPFADLGLGVAILNASSDSAQQRLAPKNFRTIYMGVRCILCRIGLALAALSIVIAGTVGWPVLLGLSDTSVVANLSCLAVLLAISFSLPLGTGSRMLQGFGEMDVVAKIAVLNPVIQIVLVVPLALALPTAAPVAVVPALSFSVVAVVTDIAGRRKAAHSLGARLPFLVARLPRGFTASRLIGQSLSFLVISLGLVVAFQLQRVILAHFSGEAEMARYALVAQYLVPVLSIIGVVAQALWPRYRAQMGRIRGRDLLAHFSLFSLLGIVGAAVMVAALLVVSHLLLENVVALSPALLIAAAVYVIAFAAHQPSAMVLNDANGLRAQAFIVSIMAIVSLSCTLVFADSFGAAGAFFSLATAVVVFQLGPTLLLAARHIRLSRKYALIFSERVN